MDNFDLNIYDNLKTVELIRGRSGYGFDLKGDRPSIIGCVRKNSPADMVGLREGDLVIAINNTKVTDLNHEKVVSLIGQSKTHLVLQVTKFLPNSSSSTSTSSQQVPLMVAPQQATKVYPQNPKINVERHRFTNILNNSSINKSEYTEDDDYDEEEDDEYFEYRNSKKNNCYDDEESIESSEDDCSMQPFYAYKSKAQNSRDNVTRGSQRRVKSTMVSTSQSTDQIKKRSKNTGLDYAFINAHNNNNENFEPSLKIKKPTSTTHKKHSSQKEQLRSPIKPHLSQSSGSLPSSNDLENKQKILNVNDLYAILNPLVRPYVFNRNNRVSNESTLCVNCAYLGTIHIPYDTISNSLKLNSIRQSIDYFVRSKQHQQQQEKQVYVNLYRDKLLIKEINDPNGEMMYFSSKQIGFCGTIKQHVDYFALITLSQSSSSSSCILFRLLPNDDFALDDILNLISRIYRYENYVFNSQVVTTNGLSTKASSSSIRDKKSLYAEYNDFLSNQHKDAAATTTITTSGSSTCNLRSSSTYSLNVELTSSVQHQELPKSCTTDALADIKQISQSSNSLNKHASHGTNKVFARNTENTQSIKMIKENLTNLFLSKFNHLQQQQQQQQTPIVVETQKSKSELKSSQTFKSKFKKSTFQFLKSKPPSLVAQTNANNLQPPNQMFTCQTNDNFFAFLDETEQQQQRQQQCQTKQKLDFKINSRLSLQQSSNNMILQRNGSKLLKQNPFTSASFGNQQRRLSDYHRPSKEKKH